MKRGCAFFAWLAIVVWVCTACAPEAVAPGGKGGNTVFVGPDGAVMLSDTAGKKDEPMIEGPSASGAPAEDVLMMNGELEAVDPELKLAFPGDVRGTLAGLHVRVGQMVRTGDPIATLDEGELRAAVEEAQLALDRARADRQREIEKRHALYLEETEAADRKYKEDRAAAEQALEDTQAALHRAQLKPPALTLRQAEVSLARAQDMEAAAADRYKQALDRPWEPQAVRDGLYKEWQRCITERELSEMGLRDARLDQELYALDLAAKKQAVSDAQERLDGLEKEQAKEDTDLTTYERAIADAETKLLQAQEKLGYTRLYAPWDGLITAVHVAAGARVSGETAIVSLLNVDDFYFVTENLSEQHIAQVHGGQEALVTLHAYARQVLAGRVESVLYKGGNEEQDSPFVVYIRLDVSDLKLLPGMTGRTEIVQGVQ